MKTFIEILTFIFIVIIVSCKGQIGSKSNQESSVQKEKPVVKNTEDLIKNYNGENNILFVFVGQKISVEELIDKETSMDRGFKARYLILQKVYGSFLSDTIEFVAYDHWGIPAFSKFQHVLLFVSAKNGLYYHQKYMYNDIYQTKSGKWAGAYAESDYEHSYNKKTTVKPIIIDFVKEISYPTSIMSNDSQVVNISYPEPYFKTVGDNAIAVYGNYVEELFILKRDGYLRAREIFK